MKTCRYCGSEIPKQSHNYSYMEFCSEKCQKAYSHVKMPKSEWLAKYGLVETGDGVYEKRCPCCGVRFETTNFQKRFCSPTCNKYAAKFAKNHPDGFTDDELFAARRMATQKRTPRTLKCLYCGTEFVSTSTSNERKYCCDSCATAYLKYGCSKAEHEKRMSERVIALRSWSPYLGGTVTKITVPAKCAWCGIDFESFRGAHCCCAEHASKWFYYGKMSESEVRQSRKRICKWCLSVFDASSTKQVCCCEKHSDCYRRHKMSLEERNAFLLTCERKCIICGSSFVRDGKLRNVCPDCLSQNMQALFGRMLNTEADFDVECELQILNAIALKRVMTAEHNRRRLEYISLFKGFTRCRYCGTLFESVDSIRYICDGCRDASTRIQRERRREKNRLYRISHYQECLEYARRSYWRHRQERCDYQKWYRNKFYQKIYARTNGLTEEQAKAHFELKANEIARLDALSADEEIRIAETRKRFHHVEMVMLLPVEERWQFSKDWTDEERAYASEISNAGSVGGFLDDGDNDEIMISELDDGNF